MKKLIFILLFLSTAIMTAVMAGENDSLTWEEDSIKSVMDTLSIEAVYENAAKWEVGNAITTVRMARKELIERGEESLDYIFFEQYGYAGGLEERANKEVIKALLDDAEWRIYDCLGDNPLGYLSYSAQFIGDFKLDQGYDSLIAMMDDTTEDRRKIRRVVIRALGNFGRPEAAGILHESLKDTTEYTRITTVGALGKLANPISIDPMLDALSDSMFTIRQAINLSFPKFGKAGLHRLKQRMETAEDGELIEYVRLVGRFRSDDTVKDAVKILRRYIDNKNPVVRGWALKALRELDRKRFDKIADKIKAEESDPFVLWLMEEE